MEPIKWISTPKCSDCEHWDKMDLACSKKRTGDRCPYKAK